jgi:hypothetical protein
MTEDAHSPTNAGPEPTPTVGAGEATFSQPAGTAAGSGWATPGDVPTGEGAGASGGADRPELLAGAAFAGGFVAAMILKRLGR